MRARRRRVRTVPTNLSIRADLVKRARAANVNLSSVMEAALEEALRAKERESWLAENTEAIDEYNKLVEFH
jgi:antitoxin CcdA